MDVNAHIVNRASITITLVASQRLYCEKGSAGTRSQQSVADDLAIFSVFHDIR